MENEIHMEPQKVSVNGSELLKKFKSSEDRYNFMREMSKKFYNFLDLFLIMTMTKWISMKYLVIKKE